MTTPAVNAGSQLLVHRCVDCRRWVYPEAERCPVCAGPLAAEPVSGEGTVFTYTVNHHAFQPAIPVPYVIAIVELAEQTDLRMATNIVGCPPDEVAVGMPVRVAFEQRGDMLVPVFERA
ncbi:OB-fold domain-containing protein [Frankia sp. CNm7]|uniref:OB-fold domain-containing protein n=1 Tax=Frankia nepalensis TaxID=1836974 RepID=A0A937USW4_9ACTN|nr:OB-fold domain-containing protein [Frankia nepalensis]MBL7501835.1 OB-fold domain-containing protein [Frankia nepalensis]MBL7514091.1 OB-fold domain-containing protein [Frankia nepalensis]MBL7522871.1 OB-fold domain-containing protein [Frankia nepalensis]MBL7632942.1 OB-fold domain-containing protein [Frankia nepalensis]